LERKILVVEDSRALAALIKKKLERELQLAVDAADTLAAVKSLVEGHRPDYFLAVLDLCLPDAPDGEVVDYISGQGIPAVVLTGTFNERLRDELFTKNVIDYFLKGQRNLDLVVQTVRRVHRNQSSKVLVVDDSRFSRNYIAKLLRRQNFQTLEAADGVEACKVVESEPDIKLIITDYHMPNMDGCQLIDELRKKHGKDRLAVIGVSASDENYLSAKFIKFGANDFINKPFSVEEFYCRVNLNLELLDLMQQIKEASNTDYLTKLFNRRYFFDVARRLYERHKRQGEPMALAMMDIDHFKRINDGYGHDAGDAALKQTANLLKSRFRANDILARFGGEEFCALMAPIDRDDAIRKLEEVRAQIAETPLFFESQEIRATISIGLALDGESSLEKMISKADQRLYQAKSSGRNRVVYDD